MARCIQHFKEYMAEAEEKDDEVVKVNDDDVERTPKKKKMKYNEIFEVKKVNTKKKK